MGKVRRGEQIGLFERPEPQPEPPKPVETVQQEQPLVSGSPVCYHCGQGGPNIWSGLLQASVHESCHKPWLEKRRDTA